MHLMPSERRVGNQYINQMVESKLQYVLCGMILAIEISLMFLLWHIPYMEQTVHIITVKITSRFGTFLFT